MEYDILNPISNKTPRFTDEQLDEIKKWFDTNSQDIEVHKTKIVMKVVNIDRVMEFLQERKFHKRSFRYPTYGDVLTEAENLKAGTSRVLTKEQVLYMFDKWVIEPDVKHELKLAFKVFDSEKRNFLDIDEIQVIVTSFEEPFDEKETLELLRDANVRGDGNVFYEDFIESLFNLAPELYNIKVEYLYENPDEDPSLLDTSNIAIPNSKGKKHN